MRICRPGAPTAADRSARRSESGEPLRRTLARQPQSGRRPACRRVRRGAQGSAGEALRPADLWATRRYLAAPRGPDILSDGGSSAWRLTRLRRGGGLGGWWVTGFESVTSRVPTGAHYRHGQRAHNGARDEIDAEIQGLPDDHRRLPHNRSAQGLAAIASAAPRSRPFANPAVATMYDTIISFFLPPHRASHVTLSFASPPRGRPRVADDFAGGDAAPAFKRVGL
jgi:hypothetical protein